MGKTIGADSSLVSDTSLGDLLAAFIGGQIVPAFASHTPVIIIGLAMRDIAMVAILPKRSKTVFTGVISFFEPASQQEIMPTMAQNQ